MGSRLRNNVTHLFECFFEVAGPQSDTPASIIQKYPDTYNDESVLKIISNFAYPCKIENYSLPEGSSKLLAIEHFSFILTNLEWTYGYCRRDPNIHTSLVILSYLPWHKFFYDLLNNIADIISSNDPESVWPFLEKILNLKVPESGEIISVSSKFTHFESQAPNQNQLPSIPENPNHAEYYNAVNVSNMLSIFASMLFERRIIFTSKHLKILSACVQAANDLLYPMTWQHIFIPVLPSNLIDTIAAPMPYLIGLPKSLMESARLLDIGDVIILDVDHNELTPTFNDDLSSLPQDVVTFLKKQLGKKAVTGDGVSRAFLRALVLLIGGYRDAFTHREGEKTVTFDENLFVESRSHSMQPFLRKMVQLQIFQQFIDERLEMLNTAHGPSGEFEIEVSNYMEKSGSKLKQQVKEYTDTVKKGGTILKNVKTKLRKDVQIAYKDLKSRLKDQPMHRNDEKYNSAPSSPIKFRKLDISAPISSHLDFATSLELMPPLKLDTNLMADLEEILLVGYSPNSVQKTLKADLEALSSKKQENIEPDLIRLDSNSSLNEDNKSISSFSQLPYEQGVENPLYSYFQTSTTSPTRQQSKSADNLLDNNNDNSFINNFKQNMNYFNSLNTDQNGVQSSSLSNQKNEEKNSKFNFASLAAAQSESFLLNEKNNISKNVFSSTKLPIKNHNSQYYENNFSPLLKTQNLNLDNNIHDNIITIINNNSKNVSFDSYNNNNNTNISNLSSFHSSSTNQSSKKINNNIYNNTLHNNNNNDNLEKNMYSNLFLNLSSSLPSTSTSISSSNSLLLKNQNLINSNNQIIQNNLNFNNVIQSDNNNLDSSNNSIIKPSSLNSLSNILQNNNSFLHKNVKLKNQANDFFSSILNNSNSQKSNGDIKSITPLIQPNENTTQSLQTNRGISQSNQSISGMQQPNGSIHQVGIPTIQPSVLSKPIPNFTTNDKSRIEFLKQQLGPTNYSCTTPKKWTKFDD